MAVSSPLHPLFRLKLIFTGETQLACKALVEQQAVFLQQIELPVFCI